MKHPSTGACILVVDDDPSMRLFCASTLKKAGYRVLEAAGSSEAMTWYATPSTTIDLLLTDLFLPPPDFQLRSAQSRFPRVNGHELILQALTRQRMLRVLVMSSHPFANLEPQGISIPAERFLSKPFSADTLLQYVATMLAAEPLRVSTNGLSTPAAKVPWFG